MTWGWAVKGDNLGTPAESAVKATWPDYNAQYLKNQLDEKRRRFDTSSFGPRDDVEKQVYLQETLKGYEGEAEACLKAEFDQWLQGHHEENNLAENGAGFYVNNEARVGSCDNHRPYYCALPDCHQSLSSSVLRYSTPPVSLGYATRADGTHPC